MAFSYKTRQFYRRLFRVILVLVLVVLLVLLCWVLWLRRFMVYTADGVRLDFSLSQQVPPGVTGQPSQTVTVPDIYFTQNTTTAPPPPVVEGGEEENPRYEGYYVTVDELLNELDVVLARIQALPEGTPVMLDVKGQWGTFYYTSALGGSSTSFDMAVMDAFFEAVNASGVHAIARLPAFRDYNFALANTGAGLKVEAGYLWVDSGSCYWLDPNSNVALDRLIEICQELRDMGFDEVAFTDFCFPDSDQYVYHQDKAATLAKATQSIVTACANNWFTVSFITNDPAFPLPDGNCHLYLQDVTAAEVQTVLGMLDEDVIDQVVFFTNTNDTRFEVCGVIRPLVMAE